jgi:hypothetical protein
MSQGPIYVSSPQRRVATSSSRVTVARQSPPASFAQAAASVPLSVVMSQALSRNSQQQQQVKVSPEPASALKSRSVTNYQGPAAYHSQVEQDVVNSRQPLPLPSASLVKVGPYAGHHLNRHEEASFRGPKSLSSYAINEDPNPHVIRKPTAPVKYTQQVTHRRNLKILPIHLTEQIMLFSR